MSGPVPFKRDRSVWHRAARIRRKEMVRREVIERGATFEEAAAKWGVCRQHAMRSLRGVVMPRSGAALVMWLLGRGGEAVVLWKCLAKELGMTRQGLKITAERCEFVDVVDSENGREAKLTLVGWNDNIWI